MPTLTSPHERDFGRADGLFGVFDTRAKAESRLRKIADEHGLCLVSLGLEKAARGAPCFAFQTRRCAGVCVGQESAIAHAARVREALSELSIARWPHAGAIAFAERHRNGMAQWHVVDNWCYLGSSEDPRRLHALAAGSSMPLFDRDTYAILRRAFKDARLDVLPLRVERVLELASPQAHMGSTSGARPRSPAGAGAPDASPRPSKQILAARRVSASQLAINFTAPLEDGPAQNG